MKKFFTMAAIAFAAFAMVSCDNEGGKTEGPEDEAPKVRKQLLALPSKIDADGNMTSGRQFRYDEAGVLVGIDEVWTNDDGTLGTWNLDIERSGNTLKLIDKANNNKVEYEWTVNEKGYVVKNGDYTYEYDSEDHLVKVIEDWGEGPQVVSICTWENGNMTSWTKENELEDEATGEKYARVKRQTYKEELNEGGIFTVFTEKSSLKKWMFEAGFFGKPSKNLVATDKWDDNEKGAEFEYRTDDDNYVVAEVKYYGGELDDETYYIWQAAE